MLTKHLKIYLKLFNYNNNKAKNILCNINNQKTSLFQSSFSLYNNNVSNNVSKSQVKNCVECLDASDPEVFDLMKNYMIIKPDFINEQEEKDIMDEIEPYMKRLRYEYDHWDNVIIFN